jgi:hypothetical protein
MASLTELRQMREAAQGRLETAQENVKRFQGRVKEADKAIAAREAELRAELEG